MSEQRFYQTRCAVKKVETFLAYMQFVKDFINKISPDYFQVSDSNFAYTDILSVCTVTR